MKYPLKVCSKLLGDIFNEPKSSMDIGIFVRFYRNTPNTFNKIRKILTGAKYFRIKI